MAERSTPEWKRNISETRRKHRLEKDIFKYGKFVHGQKLRFYLLERNLRKDECSVCGTLPIWNGLRLVLETDHIDGNRLNNTLENLRLICPNCHSQTDTYKARNKKTKKGYSSSLKITIL